MDHSLPGSSIRWIFQARVLEWGAIAFSDKTSSVAQMQIFVLYILTGLKICFFFLSGDNNFLHLYILYLFFQLNVIKPILFSPFISE